MVNLKRPIAALLLATVTPACMATRRVAPAQYLSQNQPSQMLVKDSDGSVFVLQDPLIQGDNLVGLELGTPDTVSVPVSQVSEAKVRMKSPRRTAFLIVGLTAITTLMVAGVASGLYGRGCEAKASNPLVTNCPDKDGYVFDDT